MYTSYFGLTEKPFAIAPNPRYLYMSELHREALAHLLYGISSGGCIILLTGDVGTGKTTVCRCLLEQLPETTDTAMILNPKLTITDLFKTICEELDIEIEATNPSVKTYIDKLNAHLLQTHSDGRSTALIIDEAQNLSMEILEQLRLLTNLETNTSKLLQIVLIGQPELRVIINDPKMSQVNQRVTTRYHLQPLQAIDVATYVQHRIAIAGGNRRNILFSPQALQYMAKVSKGIPRIINLLSDHSLLGAYANNSDHVSLKIMKKAADDLSDITSHKPFFTLSPGWVILLLLLTIGIPINLYLFDSRDNLSLFKQNLTTLKSIIFSTSHKTPAEQSLSAPLPLSPKPPQTEPEKDKDSSSAPANKG